MKGRRLPSKHEGSSHCWLTQLELDRPPPSLHCHYGSFTTTTKWSVPDQGIGIFCLAFVALSIFPLHPRSGSQVPYESLNESHAPYTPDAVWPVDRFPPDCSRSPSETPVLTSSK